MAKIGDLPGNQDALQQVKANMQPEKYAADINKPAAPAHGFDPNVDPGVNFKPDPSVSGVRPPSRPQALGVQQGQNPGLKFNLKATAAGENIPSVDTPPSIEAPEKGFVLGEGAANPVQTPEALQAMRARAAAAPTPPTGAGPRMRLPATVPGQGIFRGGYPAKIPGVNYTPAKGREAVTSQRAEVVPDDKFIKVAQTEPAGAVDSVAQKMSSAAQKPGADMGAAMSRSAGAEITAPVREPPPNVPFDAGAVKGTPGEDVFTSDPAFQEKMRAVGAGGSDTASATKAAAGEAAGAAKGAAAAGDSWLADGASRAAKAAAKTGIFGKMLGAAGVVGTGVDAYNAATKSGENLSENLAAIGDKDTSGFSKFGNAMEAVENAAKYYGVQRPVEKAREKLAGILQPPTVDLNAPATEAEKAAARQKIAAADNAAAQKARTESVIETGGPEEASAALDAANAKIGEATGKTPDATGKITAAKQTQLKTPYGGASETADDYTKYYQTGNKDDIVKGEASPALTTRTPYKDSSGNTVGFVDTSSEKAKNLAGKTYGAESKGIGTNAGGDYVGFGNTAAPEGTKTATAPGTASAIDSNRADLASAAAHTLADKGASAADQLEAFDRISTGRTQSNQGGGGGYAPTDYSGEMADAYATLAAPVSANASLGEMVANKHNKANAAKRLGIYAGLQQQGQQNQVYDFASRRHTAAERERNSLAALQAAHQEGLAERQLGLQEAAAQAPQLKFFQGQKTLDNEGNTTYTAPTVFNERTGEVRQIGGEQSSAKGLDPNLVSIASKRWGVTPEEAQAHLSTLSPEDIAKFQKK